MLVTGARGQLALSLAEVAMRQGADVVSLGRPALDVTHRPSVVDCIARVRPEIVVNTAAFTDVEAAERNQQLALAVNADGGGNVASACARASVPIIHISTDYVFDGSKPSPYVEVDDPAPLSAYGRSKLEGERRVASACGSHLIVRTAWLYSPFNRNFVRAMLQLAGEQHVIRVVADQIGTPTYAPHLAQVIFAIASRILLRSCRRPWGIYHVAGTGATSWCGIAEAAFATSAALGGPAASVHAIAAADYSAIASRPANSRLDCGKLKRTFGIVLPPWQTGVQSCVKRLLGHSECAPAEKAGRYAQ
jgi:dTDP-4-dehydrorhamnose reductase